MNPYQHGKGIILYERSCLRFGAGANYGHSESRPVVIECAASQGQHAAIRQFVHSDRQAALPSGSDTFKGAAAHGRQLNIRDGFVVTSGLRVPRM